MHIRTISPSASITFLNSFNRFKNLMLVSASLASQSFQIAFILVYAPPLETSIYALNSIRFRSITVSTFIWNLVLLLTCYHIMVIYSFGLWSYLSISMIRLTFLQHVWSLLNNFVILKAIFYIHISSFATVSRM